MNVIYTQNGCPKCRVLKKKLDEKYIQYSECDDINILIAKSIEFTPMLEVNGKIMDYSDAIKWVNEQ